MLGEVLRFVVWIVVIGFIADFVYSAFHRGRHLNHAFKPHRRKRLR